MIEINDLSLSYGRENVLSDISLKLENSKVISLLGLNGSGKSTLVRGIAGIKASDKGKILIDGTDIHSLNGKERAKRISYLAQNNANTDIGTAEMVLHGRYPHLGPFGRYSDEDFKIRDLAIERMGLSAVRDKKIRELSGGMRQSAYIAMALASGTDHIMLDEPTAYLDVSNQMRLMAILAELADEGKCVLAVMHDIPLAMSFSDEIIILDSGKLIFFGTPETAYESGIIEKTFGAVLRYDTDTKNYFYKYSTNVTKSPKS